MSLTFEQRAALKQQLSDARRERQREFDLEADGLRDCAYCGQPFQPVSHRQKYCGPQHRKYGWQTAIGRAYDNDKHRRRAAA